MIEVRNLCVAAGGFRLRDVCLAVGKGEYLALVGPTGAGKTLILESIAGLRPSAPGTLFLAGQDVSCWPPERRGIGYVPQDRVLFPFLDAWGNIAFPLHAAGKGRAEIAAAVEEAAAMLGISDLLRRRVRGLSGGEAQRVALARALVAKPPVLLLDEPLGAVHPELRRKLWREILGLRERFGFTAVHVTHDIEEAAALADRVAVIADGAVEAVCPAADLPRMSAG